MLNKAGLTHAFLPSQGFKFLIGGGGKIDINAGVHIVPIIAQKNLPDNCVEPRGKIVVNQNKFNLDKFCLV